MLASLLAVGSVVLGPAFAAPPVHTAGPLLADGVAASAVLVALPGLDPTRRPKARAEGAEVLDIAPAGDGLWRVVLRPAAADAARTVRLEITGAGPSGRVEESVSLEVEPAAPPRFTLPAEASPGGPPVPIAIRAPGARRLVVDVNVGTLGPVAQGPDGTATVVWTPPAKSEGPRRVVFTAADAARPEARPGLGTLALVTVQALTFDAPADAAVRLVDGPTVLATGTAAPNGRVALTVPLAPGRAEATLEVQPKVGKPSARAVALPGGPSVELGFAPLPPRLPGGAAAPGLRVLAVDAGGRPAPAGPPIKATRGRAAAGTALGDGWFALDFAAPAEPGNTELTLGEGPAAVRRVVDIVAGVGPSGLAVRPDPLPTPSSTFTLSWSGAGVPAVEGARPGGRPVPTGTRYTPSGGPLVLRAGPPGVAGGVLAQVVVEAAGPTVDGQAALRVSTLDGWGVPVPLVPVSVKSASDGVSVPASVRTGPDGQALLRVGVGAGAAGGAFELEAAGARTLVPFAVEAGALKVLPGLGTEAAQARAARWAQVAPLRRLDGGPPSPAPAVAAAAPAPTPAAPTVTAPPALGAAAPPAAPPRTRSASGSTPPPRLRVGVMGGAAAHTLRAVDGEGALAPGADTDTTATGAGGRLLLRGAFGDSPLGVEVDATYAPAAYAEAPEGGRATPVMGHVGLRVRAQQAGPVRAYGLLGGGVSPGRVLLADALGNSTVGERLLPAGRFGVGLAVEAGRFGADIAVQEAIAPWPVATTAVADLTLGIKGPLGAWLGGQWSQRRGTYEVGDSRLSPREEALLVGAGLVLEAR